MNAIPQCDPHAAYVEQRKPIDAAIRRVLDGGQYILGPAVTAFETAFAAWQGGGYAAGVGNGTDALALALRACGVGLGDAVLTASHTAVATVAAIRMVGARPVYVDIDAVTLNMDPGSLERTIEWLRGCRGLSACAVVPVHLYGCPCDMPRIMTIAQRARLAVVEDCAQAHGATIGGRKVGTWGRAAAFSFYPTKNLGALGDGGLVYSTDADCISEVRSLRQYGWRQRYVSGAEGVNSRLDELQAAILGVKLERLDADNAARRACAAVYDECLATIPVVRPHVLDGCSHVYHQYVVRIDRRGAVRERLAAQGIGTAVHYPLPVHQQPAYAADAWHAGLPVTEAVRDRILSLPMYAQLTPANARAAAGALASALHMP